MKTVKDLLRDTKKALHVFGYVNYNREDEGKYIRLVKLDIISEFSTMPKDTLVNYEFLNGVDLYIN